MFSQVCVVHRGGGCVPIHEVGAPIPSDTWDTSGQGQQAGGTDPTGSFRVLKMLEMKLLRKYFFTRRLNKAVRRSVRKKLGLDQIKNHPCHLVTNCDK